MLPPSDAGRTALLERILGHLPGLTRFVRRRMGPELARRESAADIVQSTCRELLRSASSYEDRGEASFRNWLEAAAEHKLQKRARHWRARKRDEGGERPGTPVPSGAEPAEQAAPSSAHPSHAAMLREETDRLARAFGALKPEHRDVLVRSQIDGATHAEIGLATGRSTEAVRKLVARALASLATELDAGERRGE